MTQVAITSIQQLFSSFIPGKRLIDGSDLKTLAQLLTSAVAGLTANAGQAQAGATPLTAFINEVLTVASATNSVLLPMAIPGTIVLVVNDHASNAIQVFGQPTNPNNGSTAPGDTIASATSASQAATATGVAQAAASMAIYVCFKLGQWKQGLLQ